MSMIKRLELYSLFINGRSLCKYFEFLSSITNCVVLNTVTVLFKLIPESDLLLFVTIPIHSSIVSPQVKYLRKQVIVVEDAKPNKLIRLF